MPESSRACSPSTLPTAPALPATGLGFQLEPDTDMIIDRDKSLAEGARGAGLSF